MLQEIDIYYQLGKRIIYLRKKRKMSSLDLAVAADINRNYLSDLERGQRNPTLKILRKIAIALNIDLSDLFAGISDYMVDKNKR